MSLSVGDPVGSWTAVRVRQVDAVLRLNWRFMVGLPAVESRVEIKKASSVRQGLRDSIAHEDSSAGLPEDAKFEYRRGFIIDPAVNAEAGQPGKA